MSTMEIGFRALALLGLGTSALLLGEYTGGSSALCGVGGGCDLVRQSAWARPLGVPLPLLGMLYFGLVFIVAVGPGLRRGLVPLAVLGAAAGAVFVGIQAFDVGAFCVFCLVVDASALGLGALAIAMARQPRLPARETHGLRDGSLLVLVPLAALGLHGLASERPTPVSPSATSPPATIARLQQPGTVTIVEFLDFQCPACRAQHARFQAVLPSFGDRVRVVLKHVPLAQHPFAEPAARAHHCAERQQPSAGKAMADGLFAARRPDAAAATEVASDLGLDLERFRSCLDAPGTRERLRRDLADAAAVEVEALPTFWIGTERFQGVQEVEVLRRSIERALADEIPRRG